ncbi:MAG: S41 family peptidase [Pirellulales bacterium]
MVRWIGALAVIGGCLAARPAWSEEAAPVAEGAAEKEAAQAEAAKQEEYYELYKVFADSLDQIERNYVQDVSRRDLIDAAIKGMLSKLDPYSNYIPPEEVTQFKSQVESQFTGVGMQVTVEGGKLKVLSPLVGTPAYRAGIHAGDIITHIEGQPTEGTTVDDAVRKLKGQADTEVKITVLQPPQAEPRQITLKREVIHVETVLGDHRKADDTWDFFIDAEKKIAYIRIMSFARETARDLAAALKQLEAEKVKGLVIDLRFNPGGLLSSAVEISDLFVAEGLIVSTEGRNVPKRSYQAHKAGTYEGFPIAVLVNGFSASASEILAACLQDHKRAVIVGERSFGKGSVQNVIDLEEGKSVLKLTTAGYHRPNGKNIHKLPGAKDEDEWGVQPDEGYAVKVSDEDNRRIFRERSERGMLKATSDPAVPPAAPAAIQDAPLQKAIDYLSTELAKAP